MLLAWIAASATASVTGLDVRLEYVEGKAELRVGVTGEPCPEDGPLEVSIDGQALEAQRSPTTCEIQQKLNKAWWRLQYEGKAPGEGEHTVAVKVAGEEVAHATFTVGPRPAVKLPAKITHDPIAVTSDGPALKGHLSMRATTDCSAVFKAPTRGKGPEYGVVFEPQVCKGTGKVSARLSRELEASCEPSLSSCVVDVVWGWELGSAPFDLEPKP
ncbi:MAG: hypothetical protein R3F59_17515 [Myxococcota bacterium]